jgi:hypothetical protein
MSMTVSTKWYGAKVKAEERVGAARGLLLAAEHILEESKRIVPLLEGTLERSGVASVDAGALRAAVSYDTPYAVYQHEGLDFAHPNGRQAKYLEQPLNSERGVVQDLIAREIKAAL